MAPTGSKNCDDGDDRPVDVSSGTMIPSDAMMVVEVVVVVVVTKACNRHDDMIRSSHIDGTTISML